MWAFLAQMLGDGKGAARAAAVVHHRQPRQLGFTLACQEVLTSWMLLATGPARDPEQLWHATLARIAANVAASHPGRIEPARPETTKGLLPLHAPAEDHTPTTTEPNVNHTHQNTSDGSAIRS